ncbi:hypothetical protein TBS_08850 [Thermobispora bispora]
MRTGRASAVGRAVPVPANAGRADPEAGEPGPRSPAPPGLTSIAQEEAGIGKPGATAVLARQRLAAAEVLMRRVVQVGATVAREGTGPAAAGAPAPGAHPVSGSQPSADSSGPKSVVALSGR